MRKLLYANFFRLWKSKIFWILEVLSVIIGSIFSILAIINTQSMGENWYLRNGNYYFFCVLVYIGAIISIFSSFYIGTDYSDGTIRNKLSTGHSRMDVYIVNLIVTVVCGILFAVTHMLAFICVGFPFLVIYFGRLFHL